MRKRQIRPIPLDLPSRNEDWLDLGRAAVVEVTSEEKDYPVESALVAEGIRGWRDIRAQFRNYRNPYLRSQIYAVP